MTGAFRLARGREKRAARPAAGAWAAAGEAAAHELRFETNLRGSAEYRRAITPVLVQRAVKKLMEGESGR
nr:hypothetical protein [Anaerotruncus rubiinfantis]